ncbi:MAG TPA: hypothetical protein VJ233_14645 [Hyphomicrobiaceae bacterium]|nr:hypothetical protein [Hyphomicrobiaceae bacterium]
MLLRKRCPHTGVVNYFSESDPLMSVGSVVVEARAPQAEFAWRCYIDERACGIVPDAALAEAHLKKAIARLDPALVRAR